MNTRQKAYRIILGAALAAVLFLLCTTTEKKDARTFTPRDYPGIRQEGVLRAVTEYNSISYHVEGDTVRGFDYELLHAFAADKGLKLEIVPEMSFEKRLQGVIKGQYDLLATGTLVTTRSKDSLLFSHTLLLDKQVLVQRKPEKDDDSLYIRSQLDLSHKHLHVIRHSPALLRIHNLMNEIADTIYIEEVELYGPEQLLAMVAGGDADYAVCDESIARASLAHFPNLDISTDISFTQFYAWGTGKHSPALMDTLNAWLDRYLQTGAYRKLYKRYFN